MDGLEKETAELTKEDGTGSKFNVKREDEEEEEENKKERKETCYTLKFTKTNKSHQVIVGKS